MYIYVVVAGIGKVFLRVKYDNEAALELYEKNGFKVSTHEIILTLNVAWLGFMSLANVWNLAGC